MPEFAVLEMWSDCESVAIAGNRARRAPPNVLACNERKLAAFLIIWFVAGLLQSIFTSLAGEEAYYALFGRNLAWGYFDHPPAIALITRLGMLLFAGNLGPRFMIVVLSTATLWIASRLLEHEHIPLFIITLSAMTLVNWGSFFVKTDVPLVFFETLFFYCYRKYVRQHGWFAVAAMPIAIAGMLLSKYHGILVIVFTLLSNPTLLRRASFWWITLVAMILVLPHAAWQFAHQFVTVHYHLTGRVDHGFSWKNIIQYVGTQPFVLGPLVGVVLLPVALVATARDRFERALKFNLVGVLAFFFVAAFHVHIHEHWTSIVLIPLLALAIPRIVRRFELRRLLVTLAVATIILFVPIRVYLIWNFLPASFEKYTEVVHGWELWAQDVHRLAAGRCVVFQNDCERAALYSYYTGEMAGTYNTMRCRPSQQDLWQVDDTFRGKRAMIVNTWCTKDLRRFVARNGVKLRYAYVNDFQGYSGVEIQLVHDRLIHCEAGAPIQPWIRLINHYAHPVAFKAGSELPPVITYHFFKGRDIVAQGTCDSNLAGITLEHAMLRRVLMRSPRSPGDYMLRLAIRPGWLPPSINSSRYEVTVSPIKVAEEPLVTPRVAMRNRTQVRIRSGWPLLATLLAGAVARAAKS